jgi:hypothetical protein
MSTPPKTRIAISSATTLSFLGWSEGEFFIFCAFRSLEDTIAAPENRGDKTAVIFGKCAASFYTGKSVIRMAADGAIGGSMYT